MKIDIDMGLRIKALRKSKGITQSELADMLGLNSKSSICMIEKGQTDLSQTKLKLFAQCLGTTPAYLLTGEVEKELNLTELDEILLSAIQKLDPMDKLDIYNYMKAKGLI